MTAGRGEASGPHATLSAAEAARLSGGELVRGTGGIVLRGAAVDSRLVAPGMLFVALRGASADGHRFTGEAFARGAAGALVSDASVEVPAGRALIQAPDTLRAFHRLARGVRDRGRFRVVGITGSVGKTSTKEMAAAVAARAFRTVRSPENWNTEIGVPLVLTNLPGDLQVAVIEMAMRGPGQIRELVEIAGPDIGVVTNIGESHLDFFPNREALAAAKGELLEGLPPGGCAILNADDPLAWELRSRTRASILGFGLGHADVRAEDIRPHPPVGYAFRLHTPSGSAPVTLRVPGRHSVRNALAAAAVGVALAIDVAAIAAGLGDAAPVPMRLEIIRLGNLVVLSDVYNSSPLSVAAAFEAMKDIEGAPRVAVLGDMKELGSHSSEAHRAVGVAAARQGLDLLVAFGPLAAGLAEAARAEGASRVVHTDEVEDVLQLLHRTLDRGGVALVKGSRAMAMERITAALTQAGTASGRGTGA